MHPLLASIASGRFAAPNWTSFHILSLSRSNFNFRPQYALTGWTLAVHVNNFPSSWIGALILSYFWGAYAPSRVVSGALAGNFFSYCSSPIRCHTTHVATDSGLDAESFAALLGVPSSYGFIEHHGSLPPGNVSPRQVPAYKLLK
jgi:hypothetical protein